MPSLSSLLSSNPNSFTAFLQGITSKLLPAKLNDGVQQSPRMSPYGELGVNPYMPDMYNVADEGQYFTHGNPTLGTGLATVATSTAVSDTVSYIQLKNMEQVGGKRVYLDFLRLSVSNAGAAATALHYFSAIDNTVARYTSGDAMTGNPKNVNMDSNVQSCCIMHAGPLVTVAATANQRYLGRGVIRVVIPVVGDTYLWTFGRSNAGNGGLITSGTTQCSLTFPHVPVIIGPQQTFFFSLWGPSMSTGVACTIEMGWWER